MNREEKLKLEFNEFLSSKLLLVSEDYYNRLNTESFIELKALLSNINNIITLRLTLNFIETLALLFSFSDKDKLEIIDIIQTVNPNANGFDIEIEKPIKLVAEVKGNIPINNGTVFGSAQRAGILKDFNSLKNGKKKSATNPSDFYKFMVLPDTKATKIATEKLLKQLSGDEKYRDYSFEMIAADTKRLNVGTIYIVFVKVD